MSFPSASPAPAGDSATGPQAVTFGLDTFGDVTVDLEGRPVPPPR